MWGLTVCVDSNNFMVNSYKNSKQQNIEWEISYVIMSFGIIF